MKNFEPGPCPTCHGDGMVPIDAEEAGVEVVNVPRGVPSTLPSHLRGRPLTIVSSPAFTRKTCPDCGGF